MKTISKLSLVVILLISAGSLSAQKSFKFGHIDSQGILQQMPDTKTAQTALEEETKKIQEHLKTMQVEYQNKINEYMENENLVAGSPEKWSALIKQEKESEIQGLQQRIQDFQGSAEKSLSEKQTQLYQPILDKVDKAIKEVAKEGKFIYVFDVNTLLFYSDESIDIAPLVKQKLGLQQ
jgi:outer membrane protein